MDADYKEHRVKWCLNHQVSDEQMNKWFLEYLPELGPLNCLNCGEKYTWLRNTVVGDGDRRSSSTKQPCPCEKTEFIKGQCKKCSNSNVWINSDKDCFPCDTIQKKLEMGVMIKSAGLEQCRLIWHNKKTELEKIIKQNKHVEAELRKLFSEIDAVLGLSSPIPQPNQNNQNLIIINQVEQFFIVNKIKKVERQGRQLIITFDDENANNTLTSEQEAFLNTFLTDNKLTSLNLDQLQELRNNLNNQGAGEPTNYLPWIIGGGIILVAIILFGILITRNRKKKH